MNLLWIDTASQACSIAIGNKQKLMTYQNLPVKQGQAEKLVPLIKDRLSSAQLDIHDIHKIAVTCGPGSFTAVRIGLAVARMLAQILNIDCLGISNFELIKQQIQYQKMPFVKDEFIALSIHSFRKTPFIQVMQNGQFITEALSANEALLKKYPITQLIADSDKDEEFWQSHQLKPQYLKNTDKEGFLHHLICSYLPISDTDLYPAIPLYIRDADAKASTKNTKKIMIS